MSTQQELNLSKHRSGNAVDPATISARQVRDRDRLKMLPRYFGRAMMAFEGSVYDHLRDMSGDYDGGYWQYFETTNGAFFMTPPEGRYFLTSPNGNEASVGPEAAGLVACLFACSHLAFRYQGSEAGEKLAENFHLLRDYAAFHPEARAIFALID